MSLTEVPTHGTRVRRKRDGGLYTVGSTRDGGVIGNVYWSESIIQLHPVWEGRTHFKTVTHFLNQFEVCEQ